MPRRLSVDEGLNEVDKAVQSLGDESIAVAVALGRLTSVPVTAALDIPRFDVSAMDGHAVSSCDVSSASASKPIALPIMQVVPAGTAPAGLQSGQAAAISTGAPIPPGADSVIALESCQIVGSRVVISRPVAPGLNIRRRGEDASAGSLLLPPDSLICSDTIGALLAFGVSKIHVRKRPSLALFSTGDELLGDRSDESALIADSNSPMIAAASSELGLECHNLGPVE